MAFLPVYYLTLACPSIERTMKMAEQYIAHGACALQFDMPSREPFLESPLVQEMMAGALATYDGHTPYMEALRALRRQHPEVALYLAVYPDVVERIGLLELATFCLSLPLTGLMLATPCPELELALEQAGIPLLAMAGTTINQHVAERLCAIPPERILVVSYTRPLVVNGIRHDCFADKLHGLRDLGVSARIYAVEGVADAQMMREVQEAGAAGVLVGNVLMQLWNDETALWRKMESFQVLAEK